MTGNDNKDDKDALNLEQDKMPDGTDSAREPGMPLTQQAQDAIGQRLRRSYSDIVAEPLPDRFEKLLKKLANSADGVAGKGKQS